MRIVINQEKCCGAGQCVLVAPDIFDQREEDGVVILRDERPPPSRRADVERAVQLCPAVAIAIDE